LGAYGKDAGGGGLVALISTLLRETSVPRIRVSSLQPPDVTPELLRLWEDPRLCRHFHIPLQSGSDDVLERMRRRYASDDFHRTVLRIRESIPDAAVTTDVMAGFPGETEADFEATCRTCEGLELTDLHVFPFSRRPGTIAAGMGDQPSEPVKRERVDRLLALAARLHGRFLQRFEGATVPVLWEKPASTGGLWEGLTDNYVRVLTRSERPLQNAVVLTRLLRRDDGALRGELVD
jgi:threonylcarbamoyladenosine tRNA methylthiotransferase MtaB